MREAGETGGDCFTRLRIARHGMAERDAHPGPCELADKVRRHLLRRQGDEGHAMTACRNQVEILCGRGPDMGPRVHTSFFRRQEWAFEVNTENAGLNSGDRISGCDATTHFRTAVTDH